MEAYENLLKSTPAELDAFVNALSGGYLYPSPGNDPIGNPEAVPTGRNLYGIDPERTPTPESFAVGKQLAEELIAQKRKSTGKYPKKVSFTVWGGEFINTTARTSVKSSTCSASSPSGMRAAECRMSA